MPKVHQIQCTIAHEGDVLSMSLGQKTSRTFATSGEDKFFTIWSVGNNNPQDTFGPFPSPVTSSCFSFDEELVACGNQGGTVSLYDLNSSQAINIWPAHRSAVHSIAFHPRDEKLILTCGYDGKLHVLSTQQKKQFQSYEVHRGPVNCVAVSGDGRYAATGGVDRSIKIVDLVAMKICAKFNVHSDPVNSLAFHPTEPILVSVGADRSTHFFDLEHLREFQTSFPLDSSPLEVVRFAPSYNCALTASSDYLRVVGWSPPASYENLQLGLQNVYDISFMDSAITIAASSGDRALIYRVNLANSKPFSSKSRGDVTSSFANQRQNQGSVGQSKRPTTPRMLDIAAMRRIPTDRTPAEEPPQSSSRSKVKISDKVDKNEKIPNLNIKSRISSSSQSSETSGRISSNASSRSEKKRPSSKVIKAPSNDGKRPMLRLQPDIGFDSDDDNMNIKLDNGKNKSNSRLNTNPNNANNNMKGNMNNEQNFGNEGEIYDQFRANRNSFMSMMNERYSRITRVGDMLDSNGLKKTLDSIAESGDLGSEMLSLVRLNPDAIKIEHTSSIMRIAALLIDKEPELAVTIIEEIMEAFGKLVHATLLTKANGNEEVEKRKQNCQLFVEAFKDMQQKLRSLSLSKKEQSQAASKLLNDWRIFLR